MIDFLHKTSYDLIVKPFLKHYLKKERYTSLAGFKLKIYPGVFHPTYFFSTQFFIEFIQPLNLNTKKVCEVGGGSGILSFIALSKGAQVDCLDISSTAIKGLEENLKINFSENANFNIYHSDLFDQVPKKKYDIFLINPPYFFDQAQNESAHAWYCGRNGEYFEKLFTQITEYTHTTSKIYMILAENCDMDRIKSIAKKHSFLLTIVSEKKIKWEKNYIFNIVKVP